MIYLRNLQGKEWGILDHNNFRKQVIWPSQDITYDPAIRTFIVNAAGLPFVKSFGLLHPLYFFIYFAPTSPAYEKLFCSGPAPCPVRRPEAPWGPSHPFPQTCHGQLSVELRNLSCTPHHQLHVIPPSCLLLAWAELPRSSSRVCRHHLCALMGAIWHNVPMFSVYKWPGRLRLQDKQPSSCTSDLLPTDEWPPGLDLSVLLLSPRVIHPRPVRKYPVSLVWRCWNKIAWVNYSSITFNCVMLDELLNLSDLHFFFF